MTHITWRNTTLYEYVYHICMPLSWRKFFELTEVRDEIRTISNIISASLNDDPDLEIYPELPYVMYALFLVPIKSVKVILIGQDPYHGTGQAMGLSFSVRKGVKIPSSLSNIFTELKNEGLIEETPKHGSLVKWAIQGMLMLNASLTVVKDMPNSHEKLWKNFTNMLIDYMNANCKMEKIVGLLWGAFAIKLGKKMICDSVISTHPSGFSANKSSKDAPAFIGSNCFKDVNDKLRKLKLEPLNWA